MKKLLLLFILLSFRILPQISTTEEIIEVPETLTGSIGTTSFYLKNDFTHSILLNVERVNALFSTPDTLFTVPGEDSILITVNFAPNQNVIEPGLFIYRSEDSTIYYPVRLSGTGKFGDAYDLTTFNKYDAELKTALNQMVINHTSLGYNTARDRMFENIDKQPGDTIECVYTGRKIKAATRTIAQSLGFNTEHTWPQGTFNEAEPMRSDIYHLYPTEANSNNVRGNYPFGTVVSNITWQEGGSKLGRNSSGSIVFEPRDKQKGFVSRSMLYFIIRYPNNFSGYLSLAQENELKNWNALWQVSAQESNRNNGIAFYQNKRNPFIDRPQLVDRIYRFSSNETRPVQPVYEIGPFYVIFDSTTAGDSSYAYVTITNKGTGSLSIISATIEGESFAVSELPGPVNQYSSEKIKLTFKPEQIQNYEGNLTVRTNSGIKTIYLKGEGIEPATNIFENTYVIKDFKLYQNYPNPFFNYGESATIIKYDIPHETFVVLKIYNTTGSEIATLKSEVQQAGSYSVNFTAGGLNSGVYFYKLNAGQFTQTGKMMILK